MNGKYFIIILENLKGMNVKKIQEINHFNMCYSFYIRGYKWIYFYKYSGKKYYRIIRFIKVNTLKGGD